jgi:hypothetical protein
MKKRLKIKSFPYFFAIRPDVRFPDAGGGEGCDIMGKQDFFNKNGG